MNDTTENSKHLPYEIDEERNRFHFYENHWKRVALELLTKHCPNVEGMTLLDYGCGRGETLKYAQSLGMTPTGFDIDPECVRIASEHGRAEVIDLNHVPDQIGVKSYDIATCFHVLEHVDNPKEVLSMLSRAARKYVITAVPNLHQLTNLRKPGTEPNRVNEGHLQSWDHPHFRNLAENHCNLEIVSWAHDTTIFPVVSELLRKTLGTKTLIKFETGLFRKLFPFNSLSVIALMKPND